MTLPPFSFANASAAPLSAKAHLPREVITPDFVPPTTQAAVSAFTSFFEGRSATQMAVGVRSRVIARSTAAQWMLQSPTDLPSS